MTIRADRSGYAAIAPLDRYGNYTIDLIAFDAFISHVASGCHQNFQNSPTATTIIQMPLIGFATADPWIRAPQDSYDTRRDQYWVCDIGYPRSPISAKDELESQFENISLTTKNDTITNTLTISLSKLALKTITISSISGQLIAKYDVPNDVCSEDINLQDYAPGIYIVTVAAKDNSIFNSKFIKH